MKKFSNYIELINIKKTYGNDIVLDIKEYRIPLDGIVTIVGFSGNGKTTLLNIIGLLDTPDDIDGSKIVYCIDDDMYEITFKNGKIYISKDNQKVDINCFRRDFLSFVFQENMLHPSLSPKSNVLMPLKALDRDYDSNIDELFEDIGLNQEHSKSGGQKQRTAILRAIIKKSKIIFADEPTSSLDMPRAIQALNALKEKNTIWVTHDMLLAKRFSKYIIVVEKGHLCPLSENSDEFDVLDKLENGCSSSKIESKVENISVKDSKSLLFGQKLSFIFEYAKNDLFKPRKDFTILLLIAVFSFLSILLMHKISYSLETIIQENLNDPRVSYIQIVQDSGFDKFDENDFQALQKSLKNHLILKDKCSVSKLKGYPMVKFRKKDGSFANMTLGTFQKNNKIFMKMLQENEFDIGDIDINRDISSEHPLWIRDNLNFAIIGKEARTQHEIDNQNSTKLAELDKKVTLIYAKDKLPLDQELFIRDEFFAKLFGNNPPEDFAIMFYPDDIQTSLVLLDWLKEAKNNHSIIDKKFYISDETDKYNSLKLITTIEKIVSMMMDIVLTLIIGLLMIVACFNISNNIKQKYKELAIMLSFGMQKRYFIAFYITKAILLAGISIIVTSVLFYLIEQFGLDPYLRNELFSNLLAIAKTSSNHIVSLALPFSSQILIFAIGTIFIVCLFVFLIVQAIFKIPSELMRG